MLIRTIFSLAIMLNISACATSIGHEFDTEYSAKIERGVTTKAEVRENLGDPHSVTTTQHGEVWGYMHTKGGNYFQNFATMFGTDHKIETDMLQITFSGDVVKDFTFSQMK